MSLHTENFMKKLSVLLHRRPDNPGLFLEVVHRISSYERVDSPSVSFQQSQDIFFDRSLVSLVSPLMRQLHMKTLPVIGVALPAIRHHNPQQGSRGALFLFCCLHHTVCPLDADNTFLSVYDVIIHHIIYSSLLLWTIAPWLLLSSGCPINTGVAHILPASVLNHTIFMSKRATS